MENETNQETIIEQKPHTATKPNVHTILAHSYSIYFIGLIAGVILDSIYPIKVSESQVWDILGSMFVVLGSLVVFWAQNTSRKLDAHEKDEETAIKQFKKGPYRYVRGPTHWGLGFLLFGFGLLSGMPFIVLTTVISFFTTKAVFLRKEEKFLAEKYGKPYLEYQKQVRF